MRGRKKPLQNLSPFFGEIIHEGESFQWWNISPSEFTSMRLSFFVKCRVKFNKFSCLGSFINHIHRLSDKKLTPVSLSVSLLTTVLDEIQGKISEDQDRYLKRVAFLSLISPSSYLAIIELFLYPEMRLSYIDWHKLLNFLGLKELRVVDLVEDFIKTELGIILYSAVRKDLSTGVLDINLLRVWMTEETAKELEAYTSIDRRNRAFQRIKKL